MECYDGNIEWKKTLKLAFYYLGCLVCGLVLYLILMKLSLFIMGQSLSSYKGFDSMGSFRLSRITEILSLIGTNFFGVFINNNLEISYNLITKAMYFVLFVIDIILVIGQVIRLFRDKENLKVILLMVFICCYVLAINGIYIMSEDGAYSLTYFSFVFMIILPLCLLDRSIEINKTTVLVAIEYILTLALTAGIICYCQFANGQYLSMDLSYRQAETYFTTLITQVKSVEGYSPDTPLCVIGDVGNDTTLYRNDIMAVFSMSGRDDALADAYSWKYIIEYYCGFNADYVGLEELDIEQDVIDEMPNYPESGSIKLIDDVIVIKLQ
jgi:hypothetical protein